MAAVSATQVVVINTDYLGHINGSVETSDLT